MPVKKYIPKGYPMEAVQFTGDNVKEVADFSGDSFLFCPSGNSHIKARIINKN